MKSCNKARAWFLLLAIGALSAAVARADSLAGSKVKVRVAGLKVHAFAISDVAGMRQYTYWPRGAFWHPTVCNLMQLNLHPADALLYSFRANAGLRNLVGPLGGWEDPRCELRGHFLGHYLSASANMHASLRACGGDSAEPFEVRVGALVTGLAECQAKLGNGYLSAFPEEFFDRLEAGKSVWAPYYTLHKIMAGLLDTYVKGDNSQALEVCKRMGDWVIARNARLSDAQLQKILESDHGGMNEVLANLYAVTGEEKYLRMAQRFNHLAVLQPASRREDRLTGLHVNTQVPKFVGAASQYELGGQEWLKTAATFFWETVVHERCYATGGTGESDRFPPKEKLSESLTTRNCETCATYNLLKLTRHLFCWDPKVEYADYYERAVFNHLQASQNRDRWGGDGRLCFYLPLRPGSRKVYSSPWDCYWCCVGTGLESHSKHGDSIYFHDGGDGLYVAQYFHSTLNWKAKGFTFSQDTGMPDGDTVAVVIGAQQPIELTVHLRHPGWAAGPLTVKINDKPHAFTSAPGSFAAVRRLWKQGDKMEIKLPFSLRVEAFRDNPRRFAIFYGPMLLSAQVDSAKPCPVAVVEPGKLLAALRPVEGKWGVFTGPAEIFRTPGEIAGRAVTLEPFYRMYGGKPYTVYWETCTPGEWPAKEAALRQARP